MTYEKIMECKDCNNEEVSRTSLKRICNECFKKKDNEKGKKWAKDNPEKSRARSQNWRDNNIERNRINQSKWRKDNRKKMYELEVKYRKQNPEKYKAKYTVQNRKIPFGKECLKCGSTENLQRHHPDYSKQLEIVTLCAKCHVNHHHKLEVLQLA